MTVPDEAVEAAAGELWDGADPDVTWDRLSEYVKDRTRERTRKVLDLAAPSIAAQAWEECAEGYCEQLSNKVLDWEELANPYRSRDDQ